MASFNELPDEILVSIFCYLDDHDSTKIRLERVSRRFYRCLRESWKYSRGSLDFDEFDSIEASAAFLKRVPEITHLRMIGPENYKPEEVQNLYRNVDKLRVSTLEYRSRESTQCSSNYHLINWCLTNSVEYLNTFDFKCCSNVHGGNDSDEICKTLESCVSLLLYCQKLENVRLSKIGDTDPDGGLQDLLIQLTVKTLSITDVATFYFDVSGVAELLNTHTWIESLSYFVDEWNDRYGVDFGEHREFSEILEENAGLELRSLELPVFDFKILRAIPSIQNRLPKLRNLTIKFDWTKHETGQNDAQNLMRVMKEFIEVGKRKDFEISSDLTVTRLGQKDYDFGEEFSIHLLALRDVKIKRNRDGYKWDIQIVNENVEVCIHTSISNY